MLLFQKQSLKEGQKANEEVTQAEDVVNNVISVAIGLICPNPAQPRTYFDDYALTQLAVSIQQNGIMQPLIVRRMDNGTYQLIAGERRLRAARLVNLDHVPCIVLDKEDRESAVLAILENIQRADLNYLEEAAAIKRLIDHYELTQEEAAQKLGIAQSTVANKLRLLKLSDKDKELVLRYGLTERQARAVLRLPDCKREEAVKEIYARQLNSAQTDNYVEGILVRLEEELMPKPRIINKTNPMNTIGLYLNSFNKTVEDMKSAGIHCDMTKRKTEDCIEYRLTIPLKQRG